MDYFINHQENEPKILIIGIGNEFRNDDGIGLYIVRRLRKLNFQNVTILEKSGEGTELMEAWQNNSRVFLFDAVRSGAKPGAIFRLTAHEEKIPQKFFNYSTHDFSLAEAVELARVLNQLPPFIVIYGVEGKDFSEGRELSDEVKQAADKVTTQFLDEIKNLKCEKVYSLEV